MIPVRHRRDMAKITIDGMTPEFLYLARVEAQNLKMTVEEWCIWLMEKEMQQSIYKCLRDGEIPMEYERRRT